MTVYTFKPNGTKHSVNWRDTATWTTGLIPNGGHVKAGKLAAEFLLILDHLRKWEEDGIWQLAHVR
ncbi:hypothetical protein [Sphingomonas sp. MMS24-J13]|uniref:hypothetical protein n=1 Tax=Sphingomonas sp. MMS24-J13 TaxID=3238686 RepID=UPI00384A4F47